MAATAIPPRSPGRPRSEVSRRRIVKAAAALLTTQGLRQMTIEGVADKAGVSKATIYRWWESKGELALDALAGELVARLRTVPDTGNLREDLHGYVRTLVRVYADETVGPTQAAIIGELQSDPALRKAYRERVTEPLRMLSREMFVRAAARGEIATDTDVDVVLDMLVGAVFLRLLVVRGPLNVRFADQLVDIVLDGLRRV